MGASSAMDDRTVPEGALTSELERLRQRVAELEKLESAHALAEEQLKESLDELKITYQQATIYARELNTEILQHRQAEKKILQRNRELALLNRIIAASSASLDPRAVLEITCRELTPAFNVSRVCAGLRDSKQGIVSIIADHPFDQHEPLFNRRFVIDRSPLLQTVFGQKTALHISNVQAERRFPNDLVLSRLQKAHTALFVPINDNGGRLGLLCLVSYTERSFSREDVALLEAVAGQVAGVLTRAHLYGESQRLSAAIDQAAESVVIVNHRRGIEYVNPAFEMVTGYRESEAIGRNVFTLLDSGKHSRTFFDDVWQHIEQGQVWHGRMISRRKDESLFTEDVSITPVRNNQDQIINYVMVKRDVTRELELEEQYRHAQKMEAVGRLTAGIAHDFNNLLTGISGFAELIALKLDPLDPLREFAESIQDSGNRATNLIRQLLAFSRRQVIEPQILNLNELVRDIRPILKRIVSPGVELDTSGLSVGLWSVRVDPTHLEQVIVNLTVNAYDAMPNGGDLKISTENVALKADRPPVPAGEYVLLTVCDTGVGIPAHVKDKIFEPFFTTKPKGKGTGLGLSTVLGIVEQNQGFIDLETKLDHGTTFFIYLPRVEGRVEKTVSTKHIADLPVGTETILLVEDEPSVRALARHVLQRQGYTVLEAVNGREALGYLDKSRDEIHLLLTDLVMPHVSGQELAERFRQWSPGIRILFTSGFVDDDIVRQTEQEAWQSYIQKPFTAVELVGKVRSLLDEA